MFKLNICIDPKEPYYWFILGINYLDFYVTYLDYAIYDNLPDKLEDSKDSDIVTENIFKLVIE